MTTQVVAPRRFSSVARMNSGPLASARTLPRIQTRVQTHLNKNNACLNVVCLSKRNDESAKDMELLDSKKVAAVGMLAALLIGGGMIQPDEAFAARSGGRVGGSSFSSRRSAPPPRAAPRAGGGSTVRNYNYYSAPPLVSPYGFGMPFFGGGIVAPFPFFGIGSLFNILILMFMVNVALNVINSFTNPDKNRKDDSDDDRW
jgi:uncharacterized membrane protein